MFKDERVIEFDGELSADTLVEFLLDVSEILCIYLAVLFDMFYCLNTLRLWILLTWLSNCKSKPAILTLRVISTYISYSIESSFGGIN